LITEDDLSVPLATAPPASDGRSVLLGIRPEHLVVEAGGFPSKIVVVEPTGSETHIVAQFGAQNLVGVFRERIERRPGDILNLAAPSKNMYFFDAHNGDRLVP
jgi:multiple sugar transport system ATP-binding protein